MAKQQLGLIGAVAIGLASMLGAGVFVVFSDAYRIAGSGLFLAIGLAALVASLNAWSVYSLARQVERPGGVYAYARVYVNDTASFAAGFAFVFGKIGSIAAIALAFNEYFAPQWRTWPALGAIALLTLINVLGIQRTAAVAGVLAVTTTAFLLAVTVAGLAASVATNHDAGTAPLGSALDLLQAAAVVFFAFAGYARVATLGTEVREAKRNIPRAILIALVSVLAIYLALAVALIGQLGTDLGILNAPIANLAGRVLPALPQWVTTAVATLASLGSILALLAGVSRTAAAMSEDGELPRQFARRNRFGSPWLAEVIIAVGAMSLVLVGKLVWVIGFSSFSVLFYYAIGHVSALRQFKHERVIPPWLAWLGLVLAAALALAVPGPAVPVSVAVLLVALLVRSNARISVQRKGKSRRYGGAALGVINEIFQPNAHSVHLIQEEKREARVAKPAPEDTLKPGELP